MTASVLPFACRRGAGQPALRARSQRLAQLAREDIVVVATVPRNQVHLTERFIKYSGIPCGKIMRSALEPTEDFQSMTLGIFKSECPNGRTLVLAWRLGNLHAPGPQKGEPQVDLVRPIHH
jgi:hypothetical protein